MHKRDIKNLLNKVKLGEATQAEEEIAQYWLHQLSQNGDSGLSDEDLFSVRISIWQSIQTVKSVKIRIRKMWPRIVAAASIIFILFFGAYFFIKKTDKQSQSAQLQIQDVLPGSKKAILQLSNGRQISLSDAKTGELARQGSTNITKTADGQIVYKNQHTPAATAETLYNTITTKRAGFYPLKMSDGTIAILDASSSIKYPVNFSANERRVEITGQVYFEVVHNTAKPFRVTVKGQTIEDLGTHFNVNAYDDEPGIITTLVEGSVEVNRDGQNALLQPGQEAFVNNSIHKIIIRKANIQQAIAWKDGLFRFDQTELKAVMRQVSRWYDLNVVYQGNISNDEFDGQIPRSVNLSQLLKILASNQIHFQIESDGTTKKLIIKP